MELSSAQVIGAGIAAIGIGAAAAGVGTVFGSYLQGALRNPGAAANERIWMFVGFAAARQFGHIAVTVANVIH